MIKKTIEQEKNIFIALFIYAFLLIFFCSKMSPLYPINEWADVNLYFNIGKMINEGRTLYTEAFDHKGPLIFFLYAIGAKISSTSFFGMYIIESLAWVVMIFFAYLTARLFVDKIYAFIIALLYPVLVLSHTAQGGSAEEFILIAQTVSIYFFIRYFKDTDTPTHKPSYMLVHGLMSSITLFIKINLVVFWFFPLLAIFVNLALKKEYKNLVQNMLAYLFGVSIIALPICIYFLANGALSEAWNIYILLNKEYSNISRFNLFGIIERLIGIFYLKLRYNTFEFLIVLTGVFYFPIRLLKNKLGRISIILSFLILFAAIFGSFMHIIYYAIPYYVYILPGCIVLSSFFRITPSKTIYAVSFLLILVLGIKQKDFFGMQISSLIKSEKPKGLIFQFSEIIKKEKDPTLLNLSLDEGNAVFTAANIKPTVKYFVSPNLPYSIYPDLRNEQTEYIEKKEVQFIILSQESLNYNYFSQLATLEENYRIVDLYINTEDDTHYYLYKRKD